MRKYGGFFLSLLSLLSSDKRARVIIDYYNNLDLASLPFYYDVYNTTAQ